MDCINRRNRLEDAVIAYGKLGRTSYDLATEVTHFACTHGACVMLYFDVANFFGSPDHAILKDRLKRVLGVIELSRDWYSVFRHVTKRSKLELTDLGQNSDFARRMVAASREPVASISEVRRAGIAITTNPDGYGIPQGTPISSVFSDLYVLDIDRAMVDACRQAGAIYRRYSDDILLACSPDNEAALVAAHTAIGEHRLQINAAKTERALHARQ